MNVLAVFSRIALFDLDFYGQIVAELIIFPPPGRSVQWHVKLDRGVLRFYANTGQIIYPDPQ